MNTDDLMDLQHRLGALIASEPSANRVAIVGNSASAFKLALSPPFAAGAAEFLGIYAEGWGGTVRRLDEVGSAAPDVVVVAEDAGKERLLELLANFLPPTTKVLIGGFDHLNFRDDTFDQVRRAAILPSFANGYPNCLVHIYQCLRNARAAGLEGCVAEFGMFKGGTTAIMSRFIEKLGANWKVYGFDTFDGFPPRRSILDMYAHPDCVFFDVESVRAALVGRNVEVVEGDVVETVSRLAGERMILSFVDTDNYTSACAILDVVVDATLIGGAIVFDHWTGVDRHLNTIGERIAAKRLAADSRFFNLHGTGVFLRVR